MKRNAPSRSEEQKSDPRRKRAAAQAELLHNLNLSELMEEISQTREELRLAKIAAEEVPLNRGSRLLTGWAVLGVLP